MNESRIFHVWRALLLSSTLSLITACGGGGGSASPATPPPTPPASASSSAVASSSLSSQNASLAQSSAAASSSASLASSSISSSRSSSTQSSAASSMLASSSSLSSSSSPASGMLYRGVSLAGAEFGSAGGAFGSNYIYPNQAEVDYFKSKRMNVVRLPFLWERLQPTLNTAFNSDELALLDAFVTATTAKGVSVVLDPHNYARWDGKIVGSAALPNSAFADLWSRLATRYKSNNKVLFALMNEPHSMSTEQWLSAANAGIAAIRAAGAGNLILVPGNAWTGAHSWGQNWYGTANASVMLGIVDPGNNHVFEVHQYLDGDSSGTSANCVSTTIGAERLASFTAWLRAHDKRGFLGEFAGANNATCQQAIVNMMSYLSSNSDVWAGWTWWAAGPWWGNYMFTLEPASGVDAPQMNWLSPYLP